jgi:hypothetical protein
LQMLSSAQWKGKELVWRKTCFCWCWVLCNKQGRSATSNMICATMMS